VLVHGLTFDRRTWRPVIERLDGAVTTLAVDLPAHGDSGGPPGRLEELAAQIHGWWTPSAWSAPSSWGTRWPPGSRASTRPRTRREAS
jgi:pimeloyl-ACP methyl ester carboxylesterase